MSYNNPYNNPYAPPPPISSGYAPPPPPMSGFAPPPPQFSAGGYAPPPPFPSGGVGPYAPPPPPPSVHGFGGSSFPTSTYPGSGSYCTGTNPPQFPPGGGFMPNDPISPYGNPSSFAPPPPNGHLYPPYGHH